MGGSLQVRSEPGKGSCFGFRVTLPVADNAYTVPSALTATSRAAMPGTSATLICQLKPIGSKTTASA